MTEELENFLQCVDYSYKNIVDGWLRKIFKRKSNTSLYGKYGSFTIFLNIFGIFRAVKIKKLGWKVFNKCLDSENRYRNVKHFLNFSIFL